MEDVDYAALVEETSKSTARNASEAILNDCLRHALAAARRGETTLRYPVQNVSLVKGLEKEISKRHIPVTSVGQDLILSWSK